MVQGQRPQIAVHGPEAGRERTHGYDTRKLPDQCVAGSPGKYLAATMDLWLPKLEAFSNLPVEVPDLHTHGGSYMIIGGLMFTGITVLLAVVGGRMVRLSRTAPTADLHALNADSRTPAQPEERLSIDDAIRAYTLGSAEASADPNEIGSLQVGKLADLVILTWPIAGPESFNQVPVHGSYSAGGRCTRAPG